MHILSYTSINDYNGKFAAQSSYLWMPAVLTANPVLQWANNGLLNSSYIVMLLPPILFGTLQRSYCTLPALLGGGRPQVPLYALFQAQAGDGVGYNLLPHILITMDSSACFLLEARTVQTVQESCSIV
jgi:hypothetical protein